MKDFGRDESVGRLLERTLRTRATANAPEDCPDAETLAAWSDGTLSAAEQAIVEAHAADCARCQAHLAAMARMTPADTPQSALESAVRSAIRGPRSAIRASVAARWLLPAAAAAAALSVWVWVQPVTPPAVQNEAAPLQARAEAQAVTAPAAIDRPAPAEPAAAATSPQRRAAPPAAAPPPPLARLGAAARADAALEENRDSAIVDRQRALDAAKERAQAGSSAAESRRDQASREQAAGNAQVIAAAPAAPAMAAKAFAEVRVEVVSPDPAIRWRASGSTIQRSTDAGATWQPQSSGVAAAFTAGASPQPSVCWLVGRAGIVLLSIDGQTWRRVPFPEVVDLVRVRASSASSAVVTTADGRILTTNDAGATWF